MCLLIIGEAEMLGVELPELIERIAFFLAHIAEFRGGLPAHIFDVGGAGGGVRRGGGQTACRQPGRRRLRGTR